MQTHAQENGASGPHSQKAPHRNTFKANFAEKSDSLQLDFAQAERFLKVLDPDRDEHLFQTFDDNKGRRNAALAHTRLGPLERFKDEFVRAQNAGAGIFYTVNLSDGSGKRAKDNIARVRAVWQDDDQGFTGSFPLEPHVQVETSPGKYQRLWLVDGLTTEQFGRVMKVMCGRYGCDPNAKDLARVLRLPGTFHLKDPQSPYLVTIVHESGAQPYSAQEVLDAFGVTDDPDSAQTRPQGDGTQRTPDTARARRLAFEAACRTVDDPKRGRHHEIVLLGNVLRREGILLTEEIIQTVLETFAANMRSTDTAGRVCGLNWESERRALLDGYAKPTEPDRERRHHHRIPGTHEAGIDTNVPPPKPDPAMLYGLAGDVARISAAGTEVNPVAAAACFLSFLGANVGRDLYLPVGNTWHHARAFTLHVGRTGRGRKGDSMSLVNRIRRRMEEVHAGTLGQSHHGGLSTREGLALLIHDGYTLGKEEVPPIEDKRLWVVESEFANVLHQGKRDGNTLSAALRDAWDGVSIRPAVKSCRVWASSPHIGLHACVTPGELLSMLESRELTNGFANRFLIFWAEKTGSVPFPEPTSNSTVDDLAGRVADVVRWAKGGYPATKDTRRMMLSDEASRLYADAYTRELTRSEASDVLTGLMERAAPYALRLAMLFAIMDKVLVIQPCHLDAALAWVRYWRQSVRFIFAAKANTEESQERVEHARKIIAFLSTRPDGATRTEINDKCFMRNVPAKKIDFAIQLLLTATPPRIELIEVPRPDGKRGNPIKLYRLVFKEHNESYEFNEMRDAARPSESSYGYESYEFNEMRDAARPSESSYGYESYEVNEDGSGASSSNSYNSYGNESHESRAESDNSYNSYNSYGSAENDQPAPHRQWVKPAWRVLRGIEQHYPDAEEFVV
ncbi:DNA-primase RepB domain-containing protein [Methylococcus capsulatus]|uniref:DNA-primase RepB domain-containing protein n=1 Tax=Methylococcus capsulatus TaxID=414 RepID=UPI001C53325F|nr:DNA-primase RepB domain-containing protein [Methylococcus capsulatus]QXP89108.1 DUF3987 domain-containing protein [Methylococcus capsulatus]